MEGLWTKLDSKKEECHFCDRKEHEEDLMMEHRYGKVFLICSKCKLRETLENL